MGRPDTFDNGCTIHFGSSSDDLVYEEADGDSVQAEVSLAVEHCYYHAKSLAKTAAPKAIEAFNAAVELARSSGLDTWRFKAVKQLAKLYLRMESYENVRSSIDAACEMVQHDRVATNYGEKSIVHLLERVEMAGHGEEAAHIYRAVRQQLKGGSEANKRLWSSATLKLACLYLANRNYAALGPCVKELEQTISNSSAEDHRNNLILLEVYAIQLQLYTAVGDDHKVREVHSKATAIRAILAPPRTMAIIRLCGGLLRMREGNLEQAHVDFFQAFRDFDELGNDEERIRCVKYVAMAAMLRGTEIEVLDSPEMKPWKNHPELLPLVALLQAYLANDIDAVLEVVSSGRIQINDDPLIAGHLNKIVESVRTKRLYELVEGASVIPLDTIDTELKAASAETRALLVKCIQNKGILGHIDAVSNVLRLSSEAKEHKIRYTRALLAWSFQLREALKAQMGSEMTVHINTESSS